MDPSIRFNPTWRSPLEKIAHDVNHRRQPEVPTIQSAMNALDASNIGRRDLVWLHQMKKRFNRPAYSELLRPLLSKMTAVENSLKGSNAADALLCIDTLTVSQRDLFNLTADPFGANSPLEGADPAEVFTLMLEYFRKREQASTPVCHASKEIQAAMQDALETIQAHYDESLLSSKIEKCLTQGGDLLIPGGWKGSPGHAMIYELHVDPITKRASLRIINTGEGIKEHGMNVKGYKLKVSAIEWIDIDHDKLKSAEFMTVLRQIRTGKSTQPYQVKHIYHGFRSLLGIGDRIRPLSSDIFTQKQRAGTCPFYSFLAWVGTKMTPEERCRFKLDLRISALASHVLPKQASETAPAPKTSGWFSRFSWVVSWFQKATQQPAGEEEGGLTSPSHYHLVLESSHRIAKDVMRQFEKGMIGETYVLESQKALGKIRDKLAAEKPKVFRQEDFETPKDYAVLSLSPTQRLGKPIYESIKTTQDISVFSHSSLLEQVNAIEFFQPENISCQLSLLVIDLEKALEAGEYCLVSHAAITAIQKLPLKLWETEPSKIIAVMKSLRQLSTFIVLRRIHEGHKKEVVPEELLAINKAVTLQTQGLQEIHPFFKQRFISYPWEKSMRSIQCLNPMMHPALCEEGIGPAKENRREFRAGTLGATDREFLFGARLGVDFVLRIMTPESFFSDLWRGMRPKKDNEMLLPEYFQEVCPELIAKMKNEDKQLMSYVPSVCTDIVDGYPEFYLANRMLPEEFALIKNTYLMLFLAGYPDNFSIEPLKDDKSIEDHKITPEHLNHWNPWRPSKHSEKVSTEPGQPPEIKVNFTTPAKMYDGIFDEDDRLECPNRFYWCQTVKNEELRVFCRMFCITNRNCTTSYAISFTPSDNLLREGYVNELQAFSGGTVSQKHPIDLNDLLKQPKYQELCHVFCSTQQVNEAIAYFNRQPEKIQDPDYQLILLQMVFGTRSSAREIGECEDNLLRQFLVKNLNDAEVRGDTPTAIFLCRLNRYLAQDSRFHPPFSSFTKAQELLQRKGVSEEVKSLIYAEYISAAGELKEKDPHYRLKDEDIDLLLKGIAWVGMYPIEHYPPNARILWDMETARNLYCTQIKEKLFPGGRPNETLLNAIQYEVLGIEESAWEVLKDGSWTLAAQNVHAVVFEPIEGTMRCLHRPIKVPQNITLHSDFRKCFSGPYNAKLVDPVTYSIHYKHQDYLVREVEKGKLCIEKYEGNEWWRFHSSHLPSENGREVTTGPYFSHYLCWQGFQTKELRFVSLETGKHQYTVPCNRQSFGGKASLGPFQRVQDGTILGKPSAAFSRFEHSGFIHEWVDRETRQLVEIDLPRFGLSFTHSLTDADVLECTQFPGWHMDSNQTVISLGSCPFAIVLTDGKKRKVVLPNQELKSAGRMDVLGSTLSREQQLSEGGRNTCSYFTYAVNENGELTPDDQSHASSLFLAKTLLAFRQYDEAAKLLYRFGEKLSAYTQKELATLKQIATMDAINGDTSANARAIALYAAKLALNNSAKPNWAKDDLNLCQNIYLSYLDLFAHVTAIKLDRKEEIIWVRDLLSSPNTFDKAGKLTRRLDELEQNSQSMTEASLRAQPLSVLHFSPTSISYDVSRELSDLIVTGEQPLPINQNAIFHQFETIRNALLPYFKMAIGGTPAEKKWLDSASKMMLGEKSKKAICLGFVFQTLLNHPENFHAPVINSRENVEAQLQQWWKEVLKTVGFQRLPTANIPDTTPAGYRLEHPQSQLPETPIQLNLQFIHEQYVDIHFSLFESVIPKEKPPSETEREIIEWLEQKSRVGTRRVAQAEWKRLKSDHDAFQKRPLERVYTLTTAIPTDISDVISDLTGKKQEEVESIASYEKSILALANKEPEDPFHQAARSLEQMRGTAKAVVMEDILFCLAQNDANTMHELNPYLTEQELQHLFNMAGDFLILSSRAQQREKALALCAKIEQTTSPEKKDELIQQLGEALYSRRAYDPVARPAFLVFEYFANILMRSDQVEKIELFLKGRDENLILEMIMGSGKSKVLMPLLGLMRADRKRLSLVIVTAPLFQNVATDTQHTMQHVSGKALKTLEFERNTPLTLHSLQKTRDTLRSIIEDKQCLIITSKSYVSLVLKYIELNKLFFSLDDSPAFSAQKAELREQLEIMIEIVNLFKTNSFPLLDEADTLLNILHANVSFSLGDKIPPNLVHIQLIGIIYEIFYTDPDIKKIAAVESDFNPQSQQTLTEATYKEEIQPLLTQKFIERLKGATISPETDEALKHYFDSTPDIDRLTHYLSHSQEQRAQQYFNTLPPVLQEVFALAGELLSILLVHTMTKINGENYGLDGDSPSAIPFAAVNTPNRGSVFANPTVTMCYTYQAHFKNDLTPETIQTFMQQLKWQAFMEGGDVLTETKAWKTFLMLRGETSVPMMNMSDIEFQEFAAAINKNPVAKLLIIKTLMLPQIEIFSSKIRCNPIDFVTLFDRPVTGFTGTLWNTTSMHRNLNPLPSLGTDSETIQLLWKNSKLAVHSIQPGRVDVMLDTLKQLVPQASVIIDAGGYFKEGGSESIAHLLSEKEHKPVLFYNEQGDQILTDGRNVASVKEDERVTFLDQSRTTGADVKQSDDAVGILTIGRKMLLRDLLQGAWRLRGLRKGQRIVFLIDHDVEKIIRHTLKLDNTTPIAFPQILEFTVINQSDRQGEDAFKAFTHQLNGLMGSLLLNILLDPTVDETVKGHAFRQLSDAWIIQDSTNSAEIYGQITTLEDSAAVMTAAKQQFLEKVDKKLGPLEGMLPGLTKIKSHIIQDADVIYKRALETVHEQVMNPSVMRDDTVEVQAEVAAEQQAQLAMANELQTQAKTTSSRSKQKSTYFYKTGDLVPVDRLDLDYLTHQSDQSVHLLPVAAFVETEIHDLELLHEFDGIRISVNALEGYHSGKTLLISCFGPTRIPFIHLHIDGEEATILTSAEVNRGFSNYVIDAGYVGKGPHPKLTDAMRLKIAKIKLLNGNAYYTKKERQLLKDWATSIGHAKASHVLERIGFKNQAHKQSAFLSVSSKGYSLFAPPDII